MKKFLSLILALAVLVIPVCASQMDNTDYVVDKADLLTDSEEQYLESLAAQISEQYECQTVVYTADSLGGQDITAFADDTFDYQGYGYGPGDDGIILVVDMGNREWAISTHGYGITAFTDYGQEYMMDRVLPDLSDGWYCDAFEEYLEQCDSLLSQARAGEPFDVNSGDEGVFSLARLIFSVAVGALLALIPMSGLKKEVHNVQSKSGAGDYVRSGSMKLTLSNDRFLYSHVSKRARPKNTGSSSGGGSRTHRSSSGRSHGGSRGRF